MRYWLIGILLIITLLLAACNLGAQDNDETPDPISTATLDATDPPSVSINSPEDGDEVVANNPVLVEVSTGGAAESVELFVDGESIQEVRISSPTDSTSRSVLNFTPEDGGRLTLRVVAYRGNQTSQPDQIEIEVRENQNQVTATSQGPIIDPNDPTCRALINTNLNFRRAPNTDSEVIRVLGATEVLPIVGRLADNTWLQLRSNVTLGWVSASFVTRYGNCTGLAVIAPPATPTPLASVTPNPSQTPLPSATPNPTEPPPPNLIVASINGPTEVEIPSGDSSVTIEYGVVVSNIGGPLSGSFNTSGELLPGNDTVDFGAVGNLGVNQSINLDGEIIFDTAGTFALQVTVDSDEDIDEGVEGDNIRVINITVTNE